MEQELEILKFEEKSEEDEYGNNNNVEVIKKNCLIC